MSENKTKETTASVKEFLNSVEHERKRNDSFEILEMMKEITGEQPKMWGKSLIGFGNYHYKYESGREGDWFRVGFSPRKANISLYLVYGFTQYEDLVGKLGKHKTGKGCLYINKLDDVDRSVLKELIEKSFKAKAMGEV